MMFHNLYQSSFFLTVPIKIRDLRCDKQTKGVSAGAPRPVRAGGRQLPRPRSVCTPAAPRPGSQMCPAGRSLHKAKGQSPHLARAWSPLPASLPPRSKAAQRAQGAQGPPRRAHPGSCAASLHLSRPRRRAPTPKPETRLPSATPKPEKSSPVPDCSTDPGTAPRPALSSPLGSRRTTSPRPLGPRTGAGTRRNGGRGALPWRPRAPRVPGCPRPAPGPVRAPVATPGLGAHHHQSSSPGCGLQPRAESAGSALSPLPLPMAAAARYPAGTPWAPPAAPFRRAAAATASATRPAAAHSAPGGGRTPGRSRGAASGAGGRGARNRQERNPPSPGLLASSPTGRRRKRSVKETSCERSRGRALVGPPTSHPGASPRRRGCFAKGGEPRANVFLRAACGVHPIHLTASLHAS